MRRVLTLILSLAGLAGCGLLFPSDPPEGWTIDGDVRFVDAPAAVALGEFEGNVIFAFLEKEVSDDDDWIQADTGGIDGEAAALGDEVVLDNDSTLLERFVRGNLQSVYLHVDPRGDVEQRVSGTIDFGRPIAGILLSDETLSATDNTLGISSVVYPGDDFSDRGALVGDGEGDEKIVLHPSGTGMDLNLVTSSIDSLRVLLWTDGDATVVDSCEERFPETGPLSNGDYEGCGVYEDPPLIVYFPEPRCADGEWSIEVETRGWANSLTMETLDAVPSSDRDTWWLEAHDLDQGMNDPNGWWDRWELTLPIVSAPGDYAPDKTSFNTCERFDAGRISFVFKAYDYDTRELQDCVVIVRPESSIEEVRAAVPDSGGCDVQEFWTP